MKLDMAALRLFYSKKSQKRPISSLKPKPSKKKVEVPPALHPQERPVARPAPRAAPREMASNEVAQRGERLRP